MSIAAPDLVTALRALVAHDFTYFGDFVTNCNITEDEVNAARTALAALATPPQGQVPAGWKPEIAYTVAPAVTRSAAVDPETARAMVASFAHELAHNDLGIYGRSTDGVPRNERQEGWNDAVMEETKKAGFVRAAMKKFTDEQAIAAALLIPSGYLFANIDPAGDRVVQFWMLCNDTFAPAADAEDVAPSDLPALADLYARFDYGGIAAWIGHKRNEKPWRPSRHPRSYDEAAAYLSMAASGSEEQRSTESTKPAVGAAAPVQGGVPAPIDMVLHCPKCSVQHIDAPEPNNKMDRSQIWLNLPHRSHLCHGCGHIWRPADVATNGAAAVKTTGKADSPIVGQGGEPKADVQVSSEVVPERWRAAVAFAYAHLWNINTEKGTPRSLYSPEQAAHEARKVLLPLMTTDKRRDAINAVFAAASERKDTQ